MASESSKEVALRTKLQEVKPEHTQDFIRNCNEAGIDPTTYSPELLSLLNIEITSK